MAADDGAGATIREVVALVEAARRDVLAEIDKLDTKIDARLEAHYTRHENDHDTHKVEHQREADRRTGYIRWAVTTVMTGVGTLFAIIWALGHG